jgi:hypothetical protein
MERRFTVEAKTFLFSTKVSKLRLEERRKGFVGLILVSHRCASWLAATVEEASLSTGKDEFAQSFCEDRKSLSVSRGSNKAGRFLEVVARLDGDRKGVIWIPEARSGRGWRRFVIELRLLLAGLGSSIGSAECSVNHGEGSSGSHVLSSEKRLGFKCDKLDWGLCGLGWKPKGKRAWIGRRKKTLGFGLGLGLGCGLFCLGLGLGRLGLGFPALGSGSVGQVPGSVGLGSRSSEISHPVVSGGIVVPSTEVDELIRSVTLYIWAAGWLASLVISFQDFLYISCVLRVAPLCTFYIYI